MNTATLVATLAILGSQGPLGPYGPLGGSTWNPARYISALGGWTPVVGGPLGEAGPLGPYGALGFSYRFFPETYRAGGELAILGPAGPLGPAGSLGPLGPLGAHGFRFDFRGGDGRYRGTTGQVIRSVSVGSRNFDLFEIYSDANQVPPDDTSFALLSQTSALTIDLQIPRSEWLSVLVVPEVGEAKVSVDKSPPARWYERRCEAGARLRLETSGEGSYRLFVTGLSGV